VDEVLDNSLFEREKPSITYGGFWQRFGALIIDGMIFWPITLGLTYFNITWKSSVVLIMVSLVGLGYKPFMEYVYGATWGKMAMKLVVKNRDFEKAELGDILLRNIFHIVPLVIQLFFTVRLYSDPSFESVSGWSEYSAYIASASLLTYVNFAGGFIQIVDAIVLITDKQKKSLHDKIAGTFVIQEVR
jgi:uncharacterized RDD family membrane protein YckC